MQQAHIARDAPLHTWCDADKTLLDRFTQRLEALAHAQLDPRLRAKLDAADVVQSVFRTFFRRAARGDFRLADDDSLWALLARITVRKCYQQADRFLAARRDVRRESPLAAAQAPSCAEAYSAEPTAEELAVLGETIDWLCRELGSPRKQQILDLSLAGYSVAEISSRLGYYERGIERVRAEIRDLLQQLR
jgi:RNA polymerase sigma-70 factor, ECF subfamily